MAIFLGSTLHASNETILSFYPMAALAAGVLFLFEGLFIGAVVFFGRNRGSETISNRP